jgi:hypothetical protein
LVRIAILPGDDHVWTLQITHDSFLPDCYRLSHGRLGSGSTLL